MNSRRTDHLLAAARPAAHRPTLAARISALAALCAVLIAPARLRAAEDVSPPSATPPAPSAPAARPDVDNVVVAPATEQVIDGALRYLAGKQRPDGSWGDGQHQAAITAYVMLSFMACGQVPGEGEYARPLSRALHYLLGCVQPDGYIAARDGENNMYGHGISAIVLGELYGQSHDPQIRPKLQKAIELIIRCQNGEGGWRYRPQPADADISVTVLQVVALRAAKNAGLDVPQRTIDRAVSYVKKCYHKDSGGFSYQPHQGPGFARTAAAIYSLQVCGHYDDPEVQRGSDYLVQQFRTEMEWFAYGNFYAAPAQYMIGGETWRRWYDTLSSDLLPKVRRDGGVHWDPQNNGVSPVYTTAVNTMILAMPYHYLPLYQR